MLSMTHFIRSSARLSAGFRRDQISIEPRRHPIVHRPNSDYCTVVAMMMKRDTLLATVCFVLGYISCADCFTTTLRPTLQPTSNSLSKGTPTFVRTSDLRSNLNLSKENENVVGKFTKKFAQSLLSSLFIMSNVAAMTSGLTPLGPQPAEANDSRLIGEIPGSGIVFKDILNVESFDDPKVKGVTIYVSNFQRPLTERLQKDFFSDPSYASVSCARSGPISIADNIYTGKDGEEVFEESKSLLFKTLRVKRLYDKEKNTVVYVSFNTRLNKNDDDNKSRFKSSICALGLD